MRIRKAAFAGSWYPEDATECEREIKQFLNVPTSLNEGVVPTRGGIVPHAGWFFSGAIACQVFYQLAQNCQPDVVAVCGMHLGPQSPCVIMTDGAWETPFGPIPVASDLARQVARPFDCHTESPESFNRDNTIELQLPFIKYFFPEARIVTAGVPPNATARLLGQLLSELGRQNHLQMLFIGSTDLTHYGANYGFIPQGRGKAGLEWMRQENDQRMIEAILKLDPEGIVSEALTHQNACCAGAVAATVAAVKASGAQSGHLLTYSTSFDKHPGDSFVGYAGIVF